MTTDEKKISRLINYTTLVLKLLSKNPIYVQGKIPKNIVQYNFEKKLADIFLYPKTESTGNGYEKFYDWEILDKISELSNKHGISYNIGITDNLELRIQIYVI